MAKLRCQCGHKFVIDFERLTVQSARKVRCPECGQSFPLAENNLEIPSTEVPVPTSVPVASPSNFAALITQEDPPRTIDDDDWPIAIPLSELRSDPTEADAASLWERPSVRMRVRSSGRSSQSPCSPACSSMAARPGGRCSTRLRTRW